MAVIVKPPLAGFCVKSPFSSYRIRNTRIRSPHCCRSRLLPTVRRRVYPICWAKKGESTPPAPSSLLTKKDLKRIAKDGPSLRDIFQTETITVLDDKGNEIEKDVDFVPPGVLGNVTYNLEPNWWKLPRKSYMEFYRGLQERNWTSKIYNPNAEPWKIEFFRDSGRLLRPSFDGFRVLVEKADKSQFWVNLPTPGYPSFIEDLSAPRESRGVIQAPRSEPLTHINQYGYNQVFEQIFLAYEQRMPQQVREQYLKKGWVPRDTYVYDCPGAHLLDVSFQLTPPELSLFGLWDVIPSLAFAAFAFSFLAVCLAIGIFKPRKQMPTDAIQAIEFAQSKGRARRDGRTGVLFSDVAGLESILGDLEDIVKFLQDPEKYQELGVKPPKGVLLDGPPGTGKTLIAKAIAGEAGVPFYQMSGSEFVEAIVGVGAARVRDLFKRARAQEEACIIFVDEIDALGIKRADAGVETNEEREQTLNQLLTEMDGFTPDLGVVFIGATNRADLLDPALCRPGRFDRKLRLLKPNTESRLKILKVHAKKHPLDGDVDLEQLARDLPGLSGAELENVLNESALETIRRNGDTITSKDVYNAVERVLQGVRRPAQPNQLEIGKVMAIHEAGRAIMATLLREETGRLEAVERVSIIARGKDWTRTVFYRGKDEDYTMSTKARLLERVRVTLAGRAAEEVTLNTATSYGAKDLERAYLLIEKIVCNYGMSQLGITTYAPITRTKDFMRRSFEVSVDNIDEDLFGKGLKGGMFQPSDQGQHKLIMEIHALLKEAYEECMDILYRHSDALEAVAVALLERKELSGEEVSQIVHDNPPRQRKSVAQDRASLSARREREMISSANGGGESSDVKAAPGVANSEVKKPYVSLFSGLLRGESKYKDFDG